jgi:DNA primase
MTKLTINELLEREIYPRIYSDIEVIFNEFGFTENRGGYISTTGTKVDGGEGEKGKVYVYENNPFCLIDYTRETISFWSYVKRKFNLSTNKQVLEKLAQLANFELPKIEDKEALKRIEKAQTKSDLLEKINSFLLKNLGSIEAQKTRDYLQKRGAIYLEKSLEFELGFTNSRNELFNFIHSLTSTDKVLRNEIEALFSNNFISSSNCLCFPYRSPYGKILGFTFRDINHNKESLNPKYIYTTGLKRGESFFNLKAIRGDKELIILESPLDALLGTIKGLNNIVAIGGNQLNEKQIENAKRLGARKITLALDNDKGGSTGLDKALEVCSKVGFNDLFIVEFPPNFKDLGELETQNKFNLFEEMIKEALDLPEYLVRKLIREIRTLETQNNGEELNSKQVYEIQNKALEFIQLLNTTSQKQRFESFFDSDEIKRYGLSEEALRERREELTKALNEDKLKNKLLELNNKEREALNNGDKENLETIEKERREAQIEAQSTNFENLIKPYSEEDLIKTLSSSPNSLRTGFYLSNSKNDEIEIELPNNALSYIVAPTSHGKTMALVNILLNCLELYPNKEFHFFSYEEPKEKLLIRCLNTYVNEKLDYNNSKQITNYLGGKEHFIKHDLLETFKKKKSRFFEELINSNRLKFHSANYNSKELQLALKYLSKNCNLGGVFIDYVQLLRLNNIGRLSRQEELKQISLDLLETAKEIGSPILLAAQFNRTVKSEFDMNEFNIGEAGDIERQASLILGLFNRTKGAKTNKSENGVSIPSEEALKIEVLKNRGGSTDLEGVLNFNGNTGKIEGKEENNSPF